MKSKHIDILWIVTARSGSKGVPNKNIHTLGGIPLLALRILAAKSLGAVLLSTDSESYAEIGRRYGAEVPFLRPAHLSTDSASSIDVVLHALEYVGKTGRCPEYIGLLEPTSPFISYQQLGAAVAHLSSTPTADHIVAVRETKPHPSFMQDKGDFLVSLAHKLKERAHSARQEFPTQITPSGGLYISRMAAFMQTKSFYTEKTLAFMVDNLSGLEIDSPIDLLWAEFLVERRIVELAALWKDESKHGS